MAAGTIGGNNQLRASRWKARATTVVGLVAVMCGTAFGWTVGGRRSDAAAPLTGIRVEGRRLVDSAGNPVVLRGVNRMGTEYACIQGWGFFDGTEDRSGNAATLNAMAKWHINAVRVPLNEGCWLDRDTEGLEDRRYVGANYRAAITDWVSQITGMGMVAIVDLHWSAPKGVRAETQQPMADADNSPDFWRSVATAFEDNPLVIFDLFNEPYLDRDDPPPADPWACWRDGCTVYLHKGEKQVQTPRRYEAAGMQQLVDAVRSTGATNPIMLGGLDYADRLDGIVDHRPEGGKDDYLPDDQSGQLLAAWHPYPGNNCGLEQPACWDSTVSSVMAKMPVVAGEFGRADCTAEGLEAFMNWMDQHNSSYLAWVWTVISNDRCTPGKERYDLIRNYDSETPTVPFGAAVQSHYQKV